MMSLGLLVLWVLMRVKMWFYLRSYRMQGLGRPLTATLRIFYEMIPFELIGEKLLEFLIHLFYDG
jgi:hypothetical protein